MEIAKLYEELGRVMSQLTSAQEVTQEMNKRQQAERREHQDKVDAIQERLRVIHEAVKLAENGEDPMLAKLTADQVIEMREASMSPIERSFERKNLANQVKNVVATDNDGDCATEGDCEARGPRGSIGIVG